MKPRVLAKGDPALGAVLALLREAFAELPGAPSARLGRDDLARMARAGTGLVLERDGAPVGCVFLRPSRDVEGALYLGSLAVAKAARGQGLAGALIEAAAEMARAQGYRALTLDTGAQLAGHLRLFAAAGFHVTRQRDGVVQMQRSITAPEPWRVAPDSPALADILALIRMAFAPMRGRIDPPSSAERLSEAAVGAQARDGEIWAIGTPPAACIFLTPQGDALYLGKLAVDPARRGCGFAKRLLELAQDRARAQGLARLTLKTRIELQENHAFFRHAGFEQVGRESHPGFDRPTTLLFAKEVRR